ncbi:MAG: LytTR family transcriptional regulator DNA-binding domain-containing protein [Firmicutes bacterium]|nr:LytTR family transcriptional regulator DNA-binding domain-containing protein [Bacillota bacterium]
MKIFIKKISTNEEEEILVKTHDTNAPWVEYIKQVDRSQAYIIGYKNERMHQIELKDVLYFESVDGKTFLYTLKDVYSCKNKLYELDNLPLFFRASKAMVVNSKKIKTIKPSLSGRFEIVLKNEEKIMVNRHYVAILKEKLGL